MAESTGTLSEQELRLKKEIEKMAKKKKEAEDAARLQTKIFDYQRQQPGAGIGVIR